MRAPHHCFVQVTVPREIDERGNAISFGVARRQPPTKHSLTWFIGWHASAYGDHGLVRGYNREFHAPLRDNLSCPQRSAAVFPGPWPASRLGGGSFWLTRYAECIICHYNHASYSRWCYVVLSRCSPVPECSAQAIGRSPVIHIRYEYTNDM